MEISVFDQLTSSLTDEERRRMLDQISKSLSYEETALSDEGDLLVPKLYEQRLTLTVWQRFRLFVKSLFTQEKPDDVLQYYLINKLKKEILVDYSTWINFDKGRFLPNFCTELNRLAEAITVFKGPLNDALTERRQEFYALLGGEENPSLQKKLFQATNPQEILKQHPEYNNAVLRTVIETGCNDILREIEAENRSKIRLLTRSLSHLERLCSFNFDKCFAYYSKDGSCSVNLLLKPLTKLNSILFSFNSPPPLKLLETLFLFSYKSHGLPEDAVLERLEKDMQQAVTSLKIIRDFNAFPLTKMIKVLNNNYFYAPSILSGGEDWFNLYQRFWRRRADRTYKYFITTKKKNELTSQVIATLDLLDEPAMECYAQENWPAEGKVFYQMSIGMLEVFFDQFYPRLTKGFINTLLEEGSFFKKDNRHDLQEVIQSFKAVSVNLKSLCQSLEKGGDLYNRLYNKTEEAHERVKNIQMATSIANRLALSIVQDAIDSLRIFYLILEGLSRGESMNSQYDSLINMADLAQRYYGFKDRIDQGFTFVKKFWSQLVDIKDMEERIIRIEEETSDPGAVRKDSSTEGSAQ